MYRLVENKTGSSNAIASIEIDQPIHKTFNAEVATPIKAPNSLAFHKNGLALVTRTLDRPFGTDKCEIVNYDGFGLRVVYD